MKISKICISLLFSVIILSGCGNYIPEDEKITDKYIETEEYYRSGKLYTNPVYMIQTNERLYKIEGSELSSSDAEIYYSYNIGDNLIFYNNSSYTIIENKRK